MVANALDLKSATNPEPDVDTSRDTEDLVAISYHEAGHALGYILSRRTFRYVTVRPRHRGRAGHVVVRPRKSEPLPYAVITYAGPVAEVVRKENLDVAGDDEFDDHLFGVLLTGGTTDWDKIVELSAVARRVGRFRRARNCDPPGPQ